MSRRKTPKGGIPVSQDRFTRETLELITALRPFTSARGQRLIDALNEVTESGMMADHLEVSAMAERASIMLYQHLDSAVSLSLILAASWLGQKLEAYLIERGQMEG